MVPRGTTPPTKMVIAGAGFAALEVVLAMRAFAGDAVTLDLISDQDEFVFSPAATAELFVPVPRSRWPLNDLIARAGANLILGSIDRVDPDQRRVHLTSGEVLAYDFLVIAIGGIHEPWLDAPGVTFTGPHEVPELGRHLGQVVARAEAGEQVRLAFVVPPGGSWVIPVYELALLSKQFIDAHDVGGRVEVRVVTPEDAPLAVFGQRAAQMMTGVLADAGVELSIATIVREWRNGALCTVPDGAIAADVVISMPVICGPFLPGIPHTAQGFVDADQDGRVRAHNRIFVAGDAGPFPIKQAGLACQQADRVAAIVCAHLGISTIEIPRAPVLRGLVWSGQGEHFLRRDLAGGRDESHGTVSTSAALWWPPGKVAGRFLAPFLHEVEGHELVDMPTHNGATR